MDATIPSLAVKKRPHNADVEISTSPSGSSLEYSMSSSFSSGEDLGDLEDVPMLSEFDTLQSNDRSNRNSRDLVQRRRASFAPRYRPAIAFIALAFSSYIYIAITSQSVKDPVKTAVSESVVDRHKDNKIHGNATTKEEESSSLRKFHSHSTSPVLVSTPRRSPNPSALPAPEPTLKPSPNPSVPSVPEPTQKPSPNPSEPPVPEPTQKPSPNPSLGLPTEPPSSHPISKPNVASPLNNRGGKNVEAQRRKKNLVLHVGPQKTGSTTLQDAWAPYGILGQPLKNDNYLYAFVHRNSGYFNCDQNKWGGLENCKSSPRLKRLLQTAKNNGRNLLLSDENLGDRFSPALRDVIDDNDWDVTVIVVYRRIHQWLVSWYNQINKTTNKDSNGNILFDKNGNAYRKEHTVWPDKGGSHIPAFSTWYKEFTQNWDPSEFVEKHRTIEFINAYNSSFSNVVVHNMHEDGDMVKNFMCNSVPDAHHCCNRLKYDSNRSPRDKNMSVNLNIDILAVKAREIGAMKKSISRKRAVSEIERYTKVFNKRIPLKCDNDVISEIKNWLLESEKAVFHETWSDQQTSDLEDTFDAYLPSGKLCDVDFENIFNDEQWVGFFKSLG